MVKTIDRQKILMFKQWYTWHFSPIKSLHSMDVSTTIQVYVPHIIHIYIFIYTCLSKYMY